MPNMPDPGELVSQGIAQANSIVTGFFSTVQSVGNTVMGGIQNAIANLQPPIPMGGGGTTAPKPAALPAIPTPQQLWSKVSEGIQM